MTPAPHWQKSTFSDGGDGNTCVELAVTSALIRLRESDEPAKELHTTRTALAQFLRTLKKGG
ncbi:DUF397 domain-containing protein [Streptomyces sp. NPDC093510]|uniref:DUF397 domain-containing protein n=1 Tax=Streptomyces sp. NPDC093510 TaxID=3155199 RepID=UPI0034294178